MKNNDAFNKIRLTESQNKIVENDNYPIYVKAGAGTGKTEVLIQKILHILQNDMEASLKNIVIISFTNKATDEMQQRLSERLYQKSFEYYQKGNKELSDKFKMEAYLANMSNISTIHTFCDELIQKYGLCIGYCPNYKTSNSFDKVRKIVNETTRELFLGSSDLEIEETTLVSLFLEVYKSNQNKGIYKVNNTYGSIISKPLEKLKIKFVNLYNDVVSKIQKYKLENNTMSLEDTIKISCELLKNNIPSGVS